VELAEEIPCHIPQNVCTLGLPVSERSWIRRAG